MKVICPNPLILPKNTMELGRFGGRPVCVTARGKGSPTRPDRDVARLCARRTSPACPELLIAQLHVPPHSSLAIKFPVLREPAHHREQKPHTYSQLTGGSQQAFAKAWHGSPKGGSTHSPPGGHSGKARSLL